MTETASLIYGTCVALGPVAAILRGPSRSGKSDLALRFILDTPSSLGAALVADDQVRVEAREGRLIASPPAVLAGRLEVRGIGIVTLPYAHEAELKLIVDLVESEDVPRLPSESLPTAVICGLALPIQLLAAFEASASLKLRLALAGIAS